MNGSTNYLASLDISEALDRGPDRMCREHTFSHREENSAVAALSGLLPENMCRTPK